MTAHIPLAAALLMIGASCSLFGATESDAPNTAIGTTPKDQSFVTGATEGGLFEVQSSRIALDKNVPDSVRDFAKSMVSDHTSANDKLVALAHARGYTVPERADLKQRMCLDKLSRHDGDDFVREYDRAQLKAHDGAIADFQKEAELGQDPELKAFAAQTLPTLRHHREMVNGLPYIDRDESHVQSGIMPMAEDDQAPVACLRCRSAAYSYASARPWNDKHSVDAAFSENSKAGCQR
jgi:putative membrane protein